MLQLRLAPLGHGHGDVGIELSPDELDCLPPVIRLTFISLTFINFTFIYSHSNMFHDCRLSFQILLAPRRSPAREGSPTVSPAATNPAPSSTFSILSELFVQDFTFYTFQSTYSRLHLRSDLLCVQALTNSRTLSIAVQPSPKLLFSAKSKLLRQNGGIHVEFSSLFSSSSGLLAKSRAAWTCPALRALAGINEKRGAWKNSQAPL
jgi:hypothetical protein